MKVKLISFYFLFYFFCWVSVYEGDRTPDLLGHKEIGYHLARRPGGKIDIIKRISNQCLIPRYLDRVLGFLDRILDPLMLMGVPAVVKAQSVNICKES